MQACHRWSCSSLYRLWRPFGACTCVIQLTEWSGIDPVLPGQTDRTLLRKHAIQKVHLRRDKGFPQSGGSCRLGGAPEMSVAAGAALGVGPGGRAHHPHLSSLATHGLAHLSTDSGVRSAPGQASSSPLSAAASIRWRQYTHTGHSSERSVFRKCTFGAIIRRLTPATLHVAQAAWPGRRPGWRPRFVRNSGSRSRDRL